MTAVKFTFYSLYSLKTYIFPTHQKSASDPSVSDLNNLRNVNIPYYDTYIM